MSAARETLAYVGLGSNLDSPERQVQSALEDLARLPKTQLKRHSRLYRTAPWGKVDQPSFVNAAAELRTELEAPALLDAMLAIERAHGRHRDGTRWGPRELDLDLLLYGDQCIDAPHLHVPHPQIAKRAFVLLPLADIDAELHVPGHGRVRELLENVDTDGCVPLDSP
ncbi:MAG: 2-amino-4-hydroxy-6-hydroxymethyldihydropteridine diphosphokinase [Rhodanobacteraceae bacterium]